MRSKVLVLALAATGVVGGGSAEEKQSAAAGTAVAQGGSLYTPVSDVAPHAAIGKDIAEIRALLEPAAEGGDADFAGARKIWSGGRHSRKDDEPRTLEGFVEGDAVADLVGSALEGNGAAAGLDPAQRRQWVDKGIIAALELKVLGELDAAIEKASAGETDPAEGAPHNVDEAWAFFTAEGEGLGATAERRAADFDVDGKVSEPVLEALADAQSAAKSGDVPTLRTAREDARGAMNRIFALAVTKYAEEGVEDEVARAEGMAFPWGLRSDLAEERLERVQAAFEQPGTTAAATARRTLNDSLDDLGLDRPLPTYEARPPSA